jgi:hypothetical protein
MGGYVDLGPQGRLQDGHHQNDKRILARAEGTKTVQSKSPWVDSVDLRMFLMGWDAGEKYSTDLMDHHSPNIPDAQQAKG